MDKRLTVKLNYKKYIKVYNLVEYTTEKLKLTSAVIFASKLGLGKESIVCLSDTDSDGDLFPNDILAPLFINFFIGLVVVFPRLPDFVIGCCFKSSGVLTSTKYC